MTETTPSMPPKHFTGRSLGVLPRVLAAQILAFVLIVGAGWAIAVFMAPPAHPPLWATVVAQGALAAAFSRTFGLTGKWLVAQFVLPAMAWSVLALEISAWVFLLAFVALFLVFSNVSREKVPLYLTNAATWATLSELLNQESKPGQFVDLGSGLGGTLAYLARKHPDWTFTGVETAPVPYIISQLRLMTRPNAHIRFRNLWKVNLADFDVVYAFLSPAPMPRLLAKADSEMRANALFISNSFWTEGHSCDGQVEVNDSRKTCLFFKRL